MTLVGEVQVGVTHPKHALTAGWQLHRSGYCAIKQLRVARTPVTDVSPSRGTLPVRVSGLTGKRIVQDVNLFIVGRVAPTGSHNNKLVNLNIQYSSLLIAFRRYRIGTYPFTDRACIPTVRISIIRSAKPQNILTV